MLVTIDPDQNGSQKPCTYSAISTDGGLTFTLSDNPVYQISGQDILDPENFRFDPSNWKLWAGGTPGKNILGLSTNDGVSFTHQGDFCSSSNSNNPSECYIVADVIKYDDNSFKMYAFGTSPSGQIIRSLSSSNGEDWTLDPTINLVVNTSNGVEDLDVWAPTVIKLCHNSFLMIYETKIPSNASTGFSSLAILQNDTTINIGNTLELNARIYSADNSIRDITNFGTWTSTNPSVATVNANGKVIAVSDGITNIYKTYDGINSNNIHINVVQAVPVELVFFTAVFKNKKVNLNWQTATEINNKGFEIERNVGNGWEFVDFVLGKGNSNLNTEYSYEDKTLLSGVVSYRIKQIDYDGKISYSSVVEIDLGLPKKFEIYPSYPNPFNPKTILQFSIPRATKAKVKVYNNLGQEVATLLESYLEAGIKRVEFDASRLESGVYYYKVITEYGEKTSKIMLVK